MTYLLLLAVKFSFKTALIFLVVLEEVLVFLASLSNYKKKLKFQQIASLLLLWLQIFWIMVSASGKSLLESCVTFFLPD